MQRVAYDQLPLWVCIAAALVLLTTWILIAEFVIDRYGLDNYLPLYRYGDVCLWDIAVVIGIVVLFVRASRPPRAADRPGRSSVDLTTLHFHLYAPTGSLAASRFDAVGRELERARADVLARLNEQGSAETTEVFTVESREQMQPLVGQPAGGWSETDANAVFSTYSGDGEPAYRHELGHLYSLRRWGGPAGLWLSEGVAVYAADGCAGRDLHEWGAALNATRKLVPSATWSRSTFRRLFPTSKPPASCSTSGRCMGSRPSSRC